jgi:hypothetical protein
MFGSGSESGGLDGGLAMSRNDTAVTFILTVEDNDRG